MDLQQILRWIVTAIVLMVAVVVLSLILKVAGFLLGYAIKVLLVLFLVAVVLRFIGLLQQRRR
ncbi:hypothetical protein [Rhodocaloribacter sp.]|jgi:hypothetical protein